MDPSLAIFRSEPSPCVRETDLSGSSIPRSELVAHDLFEVSGGLAVETLDILQLPLPHSVETLTLRADVIFYGVEEEFPLSEVTNQMHKFGLFVAPAGSIGGLPVFAIAEQPLHDGLARWVSLNDGSSFLLHSGDQVLCIKDAELSNIHLVERIPDLKLEDLSLYSDGSCLYLHSLDSRRIHPILTDFSRAGKPLSIGRIESFTQTENGLYCLDSRERERRTLRVFRNHALCDEIVFQVPEVRRPFEGFSNPDQILIDSKGNVHFVDFTGYAHRIQIDSSLTLNVSQSEYTPHDQDNDFRQLNFIRKDVLYHVRGAELHLWRDGYLEGAIRFRALIDEVLFSNDCLFVLFEDSRLVRLRCECAGGTVIDANNTKREN